MTIEFAAEQADSKRLCDEIVALDPTNVTYTHAYVAARRSMGFEAFVLSLRDQGRMICGCTAFLTRWARIERQLEIASIPMNSAHQVFWDGIRRFCQARRVNKLDINSFCSHSHDVPLLQGLISREARTEYYWDLSVEDIWKLVSKGHRWSINAARKAGLSIRESVDKAHLSDHCRMMSASAARRRAPGVVSGGQVDTSRLKAFLESEAGRLFQVMRGNDVVSSALVLISDKSGYYQTAGTSREGMECGASQFLVYEIARTLQGRGASEFSLGGVSGDNKGLRAFKSGFGAKPVTLENATYWLGMRLEYKAIRGLLSLAATVRTRESNTGPNT